MKINVDEAVFNKAISHGKLEVAEWLLVNLCPSDDTAYIQNFDLVVLNWLKSKSIPMSPKCLSQVISKTGDEKTVTWFIKNGAIVDNLAIMATIQQKANVLFKKLIQEYKIPLALEAYKTAILSENIEILDYLNKKGCEYDESITELAMKFKKKESLKWLVLNDKF
jgi:hypothetical protein